MVPERKQPEVPVRTDTSPGKTGRLPPPIHERPSNAINIRRSSGDGKMADFDLKMGNKPMFEAGNQTFLPNIRTRSPAIGRLTTKWRGR
jgi:hypothetical protein